MVVVSTDWQTSGRGQGTNCWESERAQNLLFSVMAQPLCVSVQQQFVLSMAGALAIKEVLDQFSPYFSIKWPNDIYWHDRKISGTLIETSLARGQISRFVYGIGLNVNQQRFLSDAPNPVSLVQITGQPLSPNARSLIVLCKAFCNNCSWFRKVKRHSSPLATMHLCFGRRAFISIAMSKDYLKPKWLAWKQMG